MICDPDCLLHTLDRSTFVDRKISPTFSMAQIGQLNRAELDVSKKSNESGLVLVQIWFESEHESKAVV